MVMQTARLIALAAVMVGSGPMARAASGRAEVNDALRAVFGSVDRNGNGVIDAGEGGHHVEAVFAAMDRNHDRRVTRAEFVGLSLGLQHVAARHGRARVYATTQARLFKRWAEHGRSEVTLASLRRGVNTELRRAAPGHALTFDRFKRAQFVGELAAAAVR